MKNNYIILYYKTEKKNLSYYMYKDLVGVENIQLCGRSRDSSIKFLHYFFAKIKDYIDEERFGHKFLYKLIKMCEDIQKVKFSKEQTNVVFINDMGLYKYYVDILLEVKTKYPNTVFVVQWLNAVSTVPLKYYEQMKRLNPAVILTDDPGDAEKYGWIFWMDCISDVGYIEPGKKSDVFFAGKAKDREQQIIDVYEKLRDNNINCDFTIVGKKSDNPNISDRYLDYGEVLARDKAAKCLLEIIQGGQVGYTCRAQEAIIFNKKLLTNNKWIINSKYYNSDFIKVFEKIGDEEISFINNDITVNYNYDKGFSPLKMVQYLEEII